MSRITILNKFVRLYLSSVRGLHADEIRDDTSAVS
jgi:hypothetical protein